MPKVLFVAAVWIVIGTSLSAQPPVLRQSAPRNGSQDRREQSLEAYVRRYDANGDGLLQRDEWSATIPRETDGDGNGVITKDEIRLRLTAVLLSAAPGDSRQRSTALNSSPAGPPVSSPLGNAKPVAGPASSPVTVPPVEGPAERLMVFARHAPAANLAELLNKHFESSEQPQVRVIPDLVSNSLLITASPELLVSVTKLIEQLDRPPTMIQLEILVVEQTKREPAAVAGAPSRTTSAQEAEEDLRTGPADEVLAKVQRWERLGKVSVLHRLSLSTLENQSAVAQIGNRRPVVQGVTLSSHGETRNVRDYNVGMIVACIPRTTSEGSVTVQLDFEKSDLVAHPDDPPLSITAAGEKIPSTRTVTSTAKSTVTVPRGQAVVLADVSTTGSGEQNRLLLVVTAGASGSAGKKRD